MFRESRCNSPIFRFILIFFNLCPLFLPLVRTFALWILAGCSRFFAACPNKNAGIWKECNDSFCSAMYMQSAMYNRGFTRGVENSVEAVGILCGTGKNTVFHTMWKRRKSTFYAVYMYRTRTDGCRICIRGCAGSFSDGFPFSEKFNIFQSAMNFPN